MMGYAKRMALSAVLFGVVLNPLFAVAEDKDTFNCTIGPITKTYGQTQWLAYSCNDDKTVVIVSAPGSPAMPFSRSCPPMPAIACSAKARATKKRPPPPSNNSNRCLKTTLRM